MEKPGSGKKSAVQDAAPAKSAGGKTAKKSPSPSRKSKSPSRKNTPGELKVIQAFPFNFYCRQIMPKSGNLRSRHDVD